ARALLRARARGGVRPAPPRRGAALGRRRPARRAHRPRTRGRVRPPRRRARAARRAPRPGTPPRLHPRAHRVLCARRAGGGAPLRRMRAAVLLVALVAACGRGDIVTENVVADLSGEITRDAVVSEASGTPVQADGIQPSERWGDAESGY